MAINIWLASWNCENQAPDSTMLDDFLVNDVTTAINNPNATEPDLIIIGLQEAKKDDNEKKFVSDRLAKAERLGNYYEQIASAYLEGRTEGKDNYLQIGVLRRKNQNNPPITNIETGNYEDTEPSDGDWLNLGKSLLGVNEKGKGGAFVKFTYSDAKNSNGLRLGFINAHLDSKKPDKTKRESQIKALLCKITGLNEKAEVQQIKEALANDFDAVFFMGDLNYRLKTFPDLQNDPVFSTVHNIETIKKDDNFQRLKQLGPDTKVSELTEWILDSNLRRYLANLDSLYTSALVDQINGYGFSFPPASHLLPTYSCDYEQRSS